MKRSASPRARGLGLGAARGEGRILSAGAFVAAVTAATSLVNVLILAAIGRELGAEALGVFGVASAVGTYLFVLGAFGTSQIITRGVAKGDKSGKNFWALLMTRAAFVVLAGVLSVLASSLIMGLLIANVVSTIMVDLALSVYYGQGRSLTAGITLGVYRGAGLVAIPVLVFTRSLAATAATLVIVTVVASIPPLVRIRSQLCREEQCHQPIRELTGRAGSLWRRGAPLAVWAALDAAVSRGDVTILGLLATRIDIGQYVAGATMMLGFASVGMAIGYVLLPALARQDDGVAATTLRRVLVRVLPCMLVIAIVLALLAPALIAFLYGSREKYRPALTVFRILILFLPAVVGGRCLQVALVARGRDRLVLVTQLLGAVTMVVGCTLGYLAAGVEGTAFASGFAYVVIAASAMVAIRWPNSQPPSVV